MKSKDQKQNQEALNQVLLCSKELQQFALKSERSYRIWRYRVKASEGISKEVRDLFLGMEKVIKAQSDETIALARWLLALNNPRVRAVPIKNGDSFIGFEVTERGSSKAHSFNMPTGKTENEESDQ